MTDKKLALIISRVSKDIPPEKVEAVLAVIFSSIKESVRAGVKVTVRGFGTFRLEERKGYAARNPRTGEALIVPPRRVVVFKASKNVMGNQNEAASHKSTQGDDGA